MEYTNISQKWSCVNAICKSIWARDWSWESSWINILNYPVHRISQSDTPSVCWTKEVFVGKWLSRQLIILVNYRKPITWYCETICMSICCGGERITHWCSELIWKWADTWNCCSKGCELVIVEFNIFCEHIRCFFDYRESYFCLNITIWSNKKFTQL